MCVVCATCTAIDIGAGLGVAIYDFEAVAEGLPGLGWVVVLFVHLIRLFSGQP